MPRPNWFLAFPIDGSFVLDLPPLPKNFRRFEPEDVHLTLAFLGGVSEQAAFSALAALDARLAQAPLAASSASLAEVVPMGGSERSYTALSALLGEGRAEATAWLAELCGPLLEAASEPRAQRAQRAPRGSAAERRPKPHVTIARPRRRVSEADRAAGLAWAAGLSLGAVRVRLERIALYTWHAERRERLFQIVAERRLS